MKKKGTAKENNFISIIVPVYNVEKYIRRCIESILNQTILNYELILIDDGSKDKSGEICDQYAKAHSRIKVIHQDNKGLSGARNTGIDWVLFNSKSDWITFVDSDDWIHPQYLEILYNACQEFNTNISICNYIRTRGEIHEIDIQAFSVKKMETEKFYCEKGVNATIICGKLYRKSCFKTIRFPEGKIHEDEFVTYRILFKEKFVSMVDIPLYFYYINNEGITSQRFSIRRYDRIEAREERTKFFYDINKYNLARREEKYIRIEKALFSIKARKNGIYDKVQKKYKLSWIQAMIILNKEMDRDSYEAELVHYYPKLIKIQSYFYKLKRILN